MIKRLPRIALRDHWEGDVLLAGKQRGHDDMGGRKHLDLPRQRDSIRRHWDDWPARDPSEKIIISVCLTKQRKPQEGYLWFRAMWEVVLSSVVGKKKKLTASGRTGAVLTKLIPLLQGSHAIG